MAPRLNIADSYGSPRYTSISQTQPDGATSAARKMTRRGNGSSRQRWGEPPRGMTEWAYGPGRRLWGAPASSWVFEQGRKDLRARQGSDQAISDWLACTEDTPRNTSPTGWGEARKSHNGWNNAGWDASTIDKLERWLGRNESAIITFRLSSLSNSWGGKPRYSRAEAQKERDGWGAESGCGENSGWDKESAWAKASGQENDGLGASMKSQETKSGFGWAKDNWDNNIAWPTGMKSRGYDSSSGHLLTLSESTRLSFKVLIGRLSNKTRKRLYTLENEQIDPGSVFGPTQGGNKALNTAFERFAEKAMLPSTPPTPDIEPKSARKVAGSSAETEHFGPPPERLPRALLHAYLQASFRLETDVTWTLLHGEISAHYHRYSGVIRDKIHGTRPLIFTMDQTATFGDILRSWKKRRSIKGDTLILYYNGDGWCIGMVMPLNSTVAMASRRSTLAGGRNANENSQEGIFARHIELDVTTLRGIGRLAVVQLLLQGSLT
ncbi:hypothetical protein AC579_4266 [Pseudocercospora musae]|uniref:Uncharacterized protein n=1 Tax=Pseudocercospora musae TaxID=113226 RepID=A0A139I6X9_9PEZI|nr:hypothetical protein AC579_4266 [Pseudocercospora musae]